MNQPPILPGNHDMRMITPGVILNCMAPEAQDLMLKVERRYEAHAKAQGVSESVPALLQWLFKESGLVDDIHDRAKEEYEKHRIQIEESIKDHPNPEFQKTIRERTVHSFTYWFFRWSGLVDSHGKAIKC